MKKEYFDAVTANNIVESFAHSGVWSDQTKGLKLSQIAPIEYTSLGNTTILL